jgi:hypothetical protein
MKYFSVTFHERNGTQEYYHDMIIQATCLDNALDKAEAAAKGWYEDEEVEVSVDSRGDKTFDFTYMGISLRLGMVAETTIKDWCKRRFEVSLIQ